MSVVTSAGAEESSEELSAFCGLFRQFLANFGGPVVFSMSVSRHRRKRPAALHYPAVGA
jgi:hypothetical protein